MHHDTVVTGGDTIRIEAGGGWQVHGVAAPLVGRTREVHVLNQLLKSAIEQCGPRICTVVGGVGMGKTRLVGEFHAQLDKHFDAVTVARGACFDQVGPPYQLFGRLLRDRFYIGMADAADVARGRLADAIGSLVPQGQAEEVSHLIGLLVGLAFPESPHARPGDADGAARAFQAMVGLIEADGRRAPLVVVLEDLQFAGDGSLALVEHLARTVRNAPVLIVCTASPDFVRPQPAYFDAGAPHSLIELPPLSDEEAARLLRECVPQVETLPDALVTLAVERSMGNPFTLESLVRLFIETGVIDTTVPGGRVDLGRLDPARIPAGQPELVRARLSALTEAERALLERAAIIGDTFWLGTLVMLCRMDGDHWPEEDKLWNSDARDEALRNLLRELRRKDIVRRSSSCRFDRDVEFAFKHRLERDALYPRDTPRRAAMHRMVAQWLEFKSAQGQGRRPVEEIARHYERAGNASRAAAFHIEAADEARAQFHNKQAIDLYLKGLQGLPEEAGVTRIDTLHNLGSTYDLVGRHDEALCYFREMARHAWLFANRAKGGVAFHKLGRSYRALGEYEFAMQHLQRARELFEEVGDAPGLAAALDDIGRVRWLQGDLGAALTFHQEGLAMRRGLGNPRSVALSLSRIGAIHVIRGDFKEGLVALRESLELRREVGDRRGEAESLNALGAIFQLREEFDEARVVYGDALALARDTGAREVEAKVLNNLGECCATLGVLDEADAHLSAALAITEETGARGIQVDVLRNLGRLALLRGDAELASARCQRALAIARDAGLKLLEGLVWATLGEVHSQTLFDASVGGEGPPRLAAEAEGAFGKAALVLEELGNETELAKVLRTHGNMLVERGDVAGGRKRLVAAAALFEKLQIEGARERTNALIAQLPPG